MTVKEDTPIDIIYTCSECQQLEEKPGLKKYKRFKQLEKEGNREESLNAMPNQVEGEKGG